MTVYMAGPDGATKEFADEAKAAEFRRAQREAEPPLLKRLRHYRNQVFYLQQKAARAVSERRGRAWALGEIESELRGINNWMVYDIGEAEREGVPTDVTNPRERRDPLALLRDRQLADLISSLDAVLDIVADNDTDDNYSPREVEYLVGVLNETLDYLCELREKRP